MLSGLGFSGKRPSQKVAGVAEHEASFARERMPMLADLLLPVAFSGNRIHRIISRAAMGPRLNPRDFSDSRSPVRPEDERSAAVVGARQAEARRARPELSRWLAAFVFRPLASPTPDAHSHTMTGKAFAPAPLGRITLANHLVMAPMTRSRAPGNVPNEMMAEYYRQRATAGLIVTEGTAPAPEGLGYARIPGLFEEKQVRGWRLTTDAVHEAGGHIFVQLMHVGRIFHELNLPAGTRGVAPSAIAAAGQMWTDQEQMKPNGTPKALSAAELTQVRDQFVRSAQLGIEAGFDGVELHGANGYLLEQFLHPRTNQRTDAYGGSVRNRARFVLDVARGVADAVGADRTGIRLSPWSTFNDMAHYPDIDEAYGYLAEELRKIGIVYVHLVDHSRLAGLASAAATAKIVRDAFTNTLIHSGNYSTLPEIEQALEDRRPALVAMARPFIANPDLVERLRRGLPLAEPNPATFYAPGPKGFADGYTDYPVAA